MGQSISPIAYRLGFFRKCNILYTTNVYFKNYNLFVKSQLICLYIEGFFKKFTWDGKRSFYLNYLFSHIDLSWGVGKLFIKIYVYNSRFFYVLFNINKQLNKCYGLNKNKLKNSFNKEKISFNKLNTFILKKKKKKKEKNLIFFLKLYFFLKQSKSLFFEIFKKKRKLYRKIVKLFILKKFRIFRKKMWKKYFLFRNLQKNDKNDENNEDVMDENINKNMNVGVFEFYKEINKYVKKNFKKKFKKRYDKKLKKIILINLFKKKLKYYNKKDIKKFMILYKQIYVQENNKEIKNIKKDIKKDINKYIVGNMNYKKKKNIRIFKIFFFFYSLLKFKMYRLFYLFFVFFFQVKPFEFFLKKIFIKDLFKFLGFISYTSMDKNLNLKIKNLSPISLTSEALGRHIWLKLRKKYSFGSVIFSLVRKFKKINLFKGMLFTINGRFTKKQRSWHSLIRYGRVPLSPQNILLDDHLIFLSLRYGAVSVRININYNNKKKIR